MTGLLWFASLAGAATTAPAPTDEIVVTGERVPRSLRETQSSVVVLTGEQVDSLAAPDRIEQLLALIPNVTLGSGGEGPTIRGQDSTGVLRDLPAFLGGTRPRATVQVDGRAVSFHEFVFGAASVWDVAQVEVFRSPQTTTQGRNSIAGAIFIETNDPTYEWEGRTRAIAGSYGTWHGSAVVSGPIAADQLAFRIAIDTRESRPASDIIDRFAGASPDRDRYEVARAKLLVEPRALPGARLEIAFAHVESQAPQIEAVRPPFRERRDPIAGYGIFGTNIDSLTGVLSYQLSPALSSRTTFSYGDSFVRRFAAPGFGESDIGIEDLSAETVLNWRPGGDDRLTAGIHYLRTDLDQFIDLAALIGFGQFDDAQRSLGVFGEAAAPLLPKLLLTAGLRYQRDEQDRTGSIGRPGRAIALAFKGRFDAWLPKLSLAYEFSERATAGLLVQRAYNPGGTSISFETGQADLFEAETLWNYEAFARASFAGGSGLFSANIFYNDFGNAQRPQTRVVTRPNGTQALVTEFGNAPAAESYGGELQLSWRFSERLSLRAGIGLLDTEVLRTADPNDPVRGKNFQRAPGFTAAAGVDWRPVDPLSLSAQARTRSGYFSDDANRPELRIGAATVVDARAAYTSGGVTLFGYARNLFDEFYLTFLAAPTFATAGDPREIGLGIEARF